jgi:hypothetical protein
MTFTQEQRDSRIARYQENWVRLSAVDALIEDLQAERKEIRAEQTRLANQLVKDEAETQREEQAGVPGEITESTGT